ncbi:MAG: ABC transporter substrate-binding protein [Deltaproteobacteria bacterium]|nr:ABC transporter substrate-binding protein [Deltaproteobacteria bacterium]
MNSLCRAISKNLSVLLFLTLCYGPTEAGQEIVAVQSMRIRPYEEAIEGFRSVCNARMNRLVLRELQGRDVVDKINEIRPEMVLAIGMDALLRVKMVKEIPVVYLMVLNPRSALDCDNITGVCMDIPQKEQLTSVCRVLPNVKNIGLLYDPVRTGHFAERAQHAATEIGIKLIANRIDRPMDVPLTVNGMKGKIDLFWMLPDLTVITPETVEFLLLFSLENEIPVLAFSEKYVELGALMSIGIDAFDIGRQAGEMAQEILSGRDVKRVQPVDARKSVISINMKIAEKLGIVINKKMIKNVKIVN